MRTTENNRSRYTYKRVEELKARINNPANLWQAIEVKENGIQVYNVEEGFEYSVIIKAERNEHTGRYYFITREGVRIPWSIIPRDKMITAAVDFLDRIESDHPATIENRSNGVTVHNNQTAGDIVEKAQALADSVAVVFGSSLPSYDMVVSIKEFCNWSEWGTEGANEAFFFAIRKQGTESGTRANVVERCKMLGTPLYIIKVERAEIDLFDMTVKVVKAEEPTTPTNEPTEEATTEPTEEATTAPTFAEVVADYAAGTWESIKDRSRKAWEVCKPSARRAAHIIVCAVFILLALAGFLACLYGWATVAGDIIPHTLAACLFISIPSLFLVTALWAFVYNWTMYHIIPTSVKDYIMYG